MGLAARLEQLQESSEDKPKWRRRPRILLCHNIPAPLHGVAPREILGKSWWDKTRREAYKSTDFHCQACGVSKYYARVHKWLEGHELYRINYSRGTMTYIETVPLCHLCHNYIHDGRMLALLEKRQVSQQKYAAVIQHGDRVLRKAGLSRPPHGQREPRRMAKWGKWRLVLNGVEHPPKYKTIEQWRGAYDR